MAADPAHPPGSDPPTPAPHHYPLPSLFCEEPLGGKPTPEPGPTHPNMLTIYGDRETQMLRLRSHSTFLVMELITQNTELGHSHVSSFGCPLMEQDYR